MASTTIHSWPTPDDTDAVSAGAAAIRTLAGAIDTTVDGKANTADAATLQQVRDDLGNDTLIAGTSTSIVYDAGTSLIEIGVVAADFATAAHDHDLTVSGEAGTAYTLVLADAQAYKRFTAATLATVTVPTNAAAEFDTGEQITLYAAGVGGVAVVGDAGVTVNGAGTIRQGQLGVLVKAAADVWDLHAPSDEPAEFGIAVTDEATPITTTGTKATFRLPSAMTLTEVRASLVGACATGTFTVDVNEGGVSVLSTTVTIDATETTSTTAATAAVISAADLADDAQITIDVDATGDNAATGLKVWLIGVRA